MLLKIKCYEQVNNNWMQKTLFSCRPTEWVWCCRLLEGSAALYSQGKRRKSLGMVPRSLSSQTNTSFWRESSAWRWKRHCDTAIKSHWVRPARGRAYRMPPLMTGERWWLNTVSLHGTLYSVHASSLHRSRAYILYGLFLLAENDVGRFNVALKNLF